MLFRRNLICFYIWLLILLTLTGCGTFLPCSRWFIALSNNRASPILHNLVRSEGVSLPSVLTQLWDKLQGPPDKRSSVVADQALVRISRGSLFGPWTFGMKNEEYWGARFQLPS